MSRAWQQTGWLQNSLPKCASVFEEASECGRPDWWIVRFYVLPHQAEPKNMIPISEIKRTRTKALILSKAIAKAADPSSTETGHMGVWQIVENGKICWQTVWPVR